jgi:hypothetical protein
VFVLLLRASCGDSANAHAHAMKSVVLAAMVYSSWL